MLEDCHQREVQFQAFQYLSEVKSWLSGLCTPTMPSSEINSQCEQVDLPCPITGGSDLPHHGRIFPAPSQEDLTCPITGGPRLPNHKRMIIYLFQ